MKRSFLKIMLLIIPSLVVLASCDQPMEITIPAINTWIKQSNLPEDDLRLDADVVTYNNEAYLLPGKGGTRFSSKPEILKYSDSNWTTIAKFDGFASAGNSLSIRNDHVIYILGGVNGSNAPTEEVRAFSVRDNSFSAETRFSATTNATYTEDKAYFFSNESFSSFDFSSGSTESLPSIPTNEPVYSVLLTTENNTIYALFTAAAENNFFAFSAESKQWIELADYPAGTRTGASIVSTTSDIYAGLGVNQEAFFDIWKYNFLSDEWVMFTEYPGVHFEAGFSFELNNELYFGGGFTGGGSISNEVLNEEVYSIRVK